MQRYFSKDQKAILDRVPTVFFILVAVYLIAQLIGLAIIFDFVETKSADEMNINDNENDEEKATTSKIDDADETSKLIQSESSSTSVRKPNSLDVDPYDASDGLTLRQAMRHVHFYKLWFMFSFCTQGPLFIQNYYKAFGETFISNDHFLATVGSFLSIASAAGRILWGLVVDKLSFKTTLIIIDTIIIAFISTYYLMSYTNSSILFLIWTAAISLATGGVFVAVSPIYEFLHHPYSQCPHSLQILIY